MRILLKSTLLMVCAMAGSALGFQTASAASFSKLAIQVNNQEGTLLTADEQVAGQAFEFAVTEDADGNTVRVDADGVANVSGKYHSEHGANNLKVVVAVDGKTKITFGNCTYNGGKFKVTTSDGQAVEIDPSEQACWKNGHTSVTEYTYTGAATELTIEGNSYTPYIGIEQIPSTAGTTYENLEGMVRWANGNESHPEYVALEPTVLDARFTVGTDLTVSGPTDYSSNIPEATTPLMTYQPSTSNAGYAEGDMIEYKVKLKKGLTFTPTSVEFDIVKYGTDNAYISWSYTIDGVEGEIVDYSDPKNQIRRNNNANPDAPLTHVEAIPANDGGRIVTLRFYISNVANNKKMSIGNVKIYGAVNGTEEVRAFKNFSIDFTTDPYTVKTPADGVLPEGVTVEGTWHDAQHGYNQTILTVPVDGPVKISLGTCRYNTALATVTTGDALLASIDCSAECGNYATWVYNSEDPATLVITTSNYVPAVSVEACELLPMVNVEYFDTNGALIGSEEVQGGTLLTYAYTVDDVTVPEGQAFRGWFGSDQFTALKVPEGTAVQDNLKLYAHATAVEVPTPTSRFIYDLTKQYFYVEDHEALEIDGRYYNNHGWLVEKGGAIRINVAGKCYVTVGNCFYSAESTATVTAEDGTIVAEFPVKADADGAEYTFTYDGPAGWLTITFPEGSYTHSVAAWNVVDFVDYDEESGYYQIPAGDVSSLLIAIKAASGNEGTKIFLPKGVYDLGETVLTGISGKNISIIGEDMKETIIVNAPPKEIEGIGTTATFFNTSDGLYLQDLTLRNAMEFNGGTGRAVTLQDKGKNTICKNVSLESYQDTYYSNNNSAYFYFEDGEIHGVVDYVCGGGDVYFNRVRFVNESIKDATIAAPNGAIKYGYVMNECTIETLCNKFNFGRSWGHFSGLAWLNTTINQPEKLVASRFTTAGMNCAADCFKEYNSMDADGNVISPESNYLTFTHSTGNTEYETILTAEEAAEYALDKVFPDWDPASIAAQVTYTSGEALEGNVYLVDGKIYAGTLPEGQIKVRKANARGGFGPEVEATVTGIVKVESSASVVESKFFNPQGLEVSADCLGVVIRVDKLSDGTVRTTKTIRK